ncbi:hypothetical protein N7462_008456 [Penicillium macrosclerotiorum]|uniref:uncharacterized protein n=1 Tax=Penicillium macrosclerotiorum TaxID=303699 RepID=UPI002548BA7F|nr:uncharacterized protein N7462_008456 [Penicillium macrosclerotiorum]KAJ5675559.1 hypothetical protein N7462_008456 [Penicillium macrosclerotiorum]
MDIHSSKESKPTLAKSAEPTPLQIKPDGASLTGLNANNFPKLEFLHMKDHQKVLVSIEHYILKTIGKYYSTIADKHDFAAELLQARVQPTGWASGQEVLDCYYAVLNAPQRSNIET